MLRGIFENWYTQERAVGLNDTIAKLGSFEFCEFENADGKPAALKNSPRDVNGSKHAPTRLPPAGPPEAHVEVLFLRRTCRSNG